MTAQDWLKLAHEHGASVTIDGDHLKLRGPNPLPNEVMRGLRDHKAEVIVLLHVEERRQKVLAQFEKNPTAQRAYLTDDRTDPLNVIITVALRSGETGELIVPRASYDPFLFLECITSFQSGVIQ